ncbi:MAG: O-antigen ligase family protein [Alphaproteobacteria bacterium]
MKTGPTFGKFILFPILACAYVEIISPLLIYIDAGPRLGDFWSDLQVQIIMAPRLEHKIFWPAMAVISVIVVVINWSRITLAPHIIALFMYLAFAGLSVLWAYKPEFAAIRFAQQAMIIISIVLPVLLTARTVDIFRGLFLCFALALILNLYFVFSQPPMVIENVRVSYPGYFVFKSMLGQCAAIAFMLSLHEMLYPGWRRVQGIIVAVIALYLVVVSDSMGSLTLAFFAPMLAGITIFVGKAVRVSPAFVLLPVPIVYTVLSKVVGNLISRISWHLFGNYTLSGRTIIWDFANYMISQRRFLGWGYQSFWLVGQDAPSVVEAPGWVRNMPNAHNGYLDTMLDTGYFGIILFVIFIFMTLHAIGRVIEHDARRGWFLLTLALFVIQINFIESTWMHGMDIIWLLFLFVVAEAGRHWQPLPPSGSEPTRRGPSGA